jgi:ribonuclease HII
MTQIIKPTFLLENKCGNNVVGIDEAGCGPWAGPVVAAAAFLKQDKIPLSLLEKIHDSKKLTAKRRELIFEELQSLKGIALDYGIASASVEEIDSLNIAGATKLAMKRALDQLEPLPNYALVDGNRKPDLPCNVIMVIKGDQTSYSIATASILAKVTRDRLMADLDRQYPHYGWKANAGYGTAHHQQALLTYGVSIHHRRSFAPIAKLLP